MRRRAVRTTESVGKTLLGNASGEEIFRLLFRRHPIPMWIYDLETLDFLDLNDAAVEKYGYDRNEFLKMTIKDIRPADDDTRLHTDTAKIRSELSHSGEWRHTLKGGRIIDVEITSRTLEYNGHPAALLIAQDITERKQAARVIQESEKRFRAIFDQSPLGIALVDMQGHPIISNAPLSKMLGYSSDELSKMKFTDFTYPEDVDKDLNQFAALIEGKISSYKLEKRFVHKNRSLVWVNLSVTILRDESGAAQDIIGMAEDITDRKKSEETLLASEIRYRRLFETAKDGILILDADTGSVVDVNPFLMKILGYSRHQFIGKRVWELGFLKDKIANQENFLELKKMGYVRYEDMPLETSDGRRIDVEFVSNVYEVNHVNVIQCNIRDITARKRAEAEIRETEERFRLVFENVFDGISIYSENADPLKRRLVECNKQYAAIAGRSREELLELGFTRALQVPSVDAEKKNEVWSIDRLTPLQGSFSWLRPDGKENTVEYVGAPIIWRGKAYTIGIDRDTTERKAIEEDLRKSEIKYRSMFENIQDVYYEASIEGTILEVSPSINLLSKGQYQRDDLLGKSIYDFYPDPGERIALLAQLQGTGHITDFEMVLINRDGSHVPCSISANIRLDDQGRPEFIIGSLRDITERKKSEESRILITTALESTANGISITDVKGNFVWVNKAFTAMTGYTSKEVLGKNPRILKSGIQDDVFNKSIWETILAGKVWKGELINKKKDGTLYDDDLTITPLKNGDGEITNFIAIEQDITERKHIAVELKRRKEFLEAIMESSMDVIFTVESSGRISFCNPRVTSMLGYQCEEILERHFMEFIPEEYRAELSERWKNLLQGTVGTCELQIIRKDGTRADCLISYSPIQGFNEKLVIVTDITVHKAAETKNRMLAHAIKSISEYVSITDLDNKTLFVNEAFLKSYGYTESELLGKNIGMVRSHENTPEIAADILSATNHGSWQGEIMNRRKDGSEFLISLSTSIVTDEKGNAMALIGVATDITERKKAEEKLRYNAALIENINDAIIASDAQYRITAWNTCAESLYGWRAEEVLGANGLDIVRTEWAEAEAEKVRHMISDSGRWRGEATQVRKDGVRIPVEISSEVLRNEKGEVTGYLSANRDVTERKRDEEKRKSLESQLQQAQKLESIGTLASGIAHDFNNILGIILGHSSLLIRLREDAVMYAESVEAITKATQRGAVLVKQLMLFARKTEPLLESVKVNNIITELANLLQQTFPKTIIITTSLEPDVPAIVADSSQIHQVLMNLLVNARDAILENGTISIITSTIEGGAVRQQFHEAKARRYVRIEVTDTGTGMDEATRRKVFEPFFTTKTRGKGTGLGLAVVFGIVTHHNGFIDVRSELGKGTSFVLYLPIPERTPNEVPMVKKPLEEIAGGTETVLLIEDEKVLSTLAKNILVSKGYTVLTAEDGMQGVEMYRTHQKQIAVVLSDIGLPTFGGHEVFRKIRAINPDAKIIFASGFFDPETKSEMYKAGLKCFIQKPYLQDEVLRKVRQTIDAK